MSGLLADVLAAHGSAERFAARTEIAVRISASGLAFTLKGQRGAIRDAVGRVATAGQHVVYEPYGGDGHRGVFDSGDVRIEAPDGSTVAERRDARRAFRRVRQQLRWDALDMLYFSGQALWTYVSLPYVLERPGYEVDELDGRRLRVRFPPDVHTHCREQVLHADESGLIRRHDYTAEPMGPLAIAANLSLAFGDHDGLTLATRRRVNPRTPGGRVLRGPRLVWIEMDPEPVRDPSLPRRG